jgi:hypothetical protein
MEFGDKTNDRRSVNLVPMGSSPLESLLAPRKAIGIAWLRHLVCIAAMLLVLELFQHMRGDWFRWLATVRYNPQFQEGWAWWHGRLDLRYRLWDTAQVSELSKAYNVYPPLQSIIGFVLEAPFAGQESMPEFRLAPFLLFALPLPIVGYWIFLRRTGGAGWAALLTLGWLGGTAVMPCIAAARRDDFHHVNHLISQIGLLLLAGEVLGRRRIWVMLVALTLCAWTRQLTGLFVIPVYYAGCCAPFGAKSETPSLRPWWARLATLLLGLAILAGVPLALNAAKFGSPLASGYNLIYRDRDNQAAKNLQAHGLFSYHFVASNACYMNLAVPWGRDEGGRVKWKPSPDGGSLWVSTPLALLVWIGARIWWRDIAARILMLCSLPIVLGHLCYHNTGYVQTGYYRFALDYLPVWLVVAAPWLSSRWRRWATPLCIVWSLAYFAMVRHWSGPNAI